MKIISNISGPGEAHLIYFAKEIVSGSKYFEKRLVMFFKENIN